MRAKQRLSRTGAVYCEENIVSDLNPNRDKVQKVWKRGQAG